MKSLASTIRSYTAENTPLSYLYPNLHRLDELVYRSAQPTVQTVRKLHRRIGLKTIVNLRGKKSGSRVQRSQEAICRELDISLIYADLKSRELPKLETIQHCYAIIDAIDSPTLVHCKAGSDRAGLFSTLYFLRKHQQLPSVSRQLRFFPYAHLRHSKTGILDLYFDEYESAYQRDGLSLEEFARQPQYYAKIEEEFHPLPWFEWISKKVLRQG